MSEARATGARGDLDICRVLVERHPGDVRHLAALAGGLYNYAYRLIQVGRTGEAHDVLAECHRHYATLHASEPGRHVVALCDVLLRVALTFVMEGRYDEAERQGRQALDSYAEADADDELEREFGKLRARTLIGRALLLGGRPDDALVEFDAALFLGEQLRQDAGVEGTDFGWLAQAPESFRLAAPEWLGAAVAATELHDAMGRWSIAADAANIAMRIAGGLAAIGDDTAHHRFVAIHSRAQTIWWSAENMVQAAAERAGPFQEVIVSGGHVVIGPHLQPDLARTSRLAGWGDPPTSLPSRAPGVTPRTGP